MTIAGSWLNRSASLTSSYPASRLNTDCQNWAGLTNRVTQVRAAQALAVTFLREPDALVRLLVDAGFEERRRHMTAITFPRRLDAAYRELLAKTPPAITDRYLLEVKGDEALVRFDVLNVALRKRP